MDIVVCVKRVPLTEEVDIIIDDEKKGIKMDQLAFVLNDWDNYAIEEAILLKEKHGGTVTALTVGDEDDEEVLRRSLAMGADRAIRIDAGDVSKFDSFVISKILSKTTVSTSVRNRSAGTSSPFAYSTRAYRVKALSPAPTQAITRSAPAIPISHNVPTRSRTISASSGRTSVSYSPPPG